MKNKQKTDDNKTNKKLKVKKKSKFTLESRRQIAKENNCMQLRRKLQMSDINFATKDE